MLKLVVALVVTLWAGWVGNLLAGGNQSSDWYRRLAKPEWNPPSAVFAPVWTVLYVLMGTAAWLVWRKADEAPVLLPLGLFAVQLVLNAAWTGLFFGLRRPDLAFYEILILWLAIVATVVAFWRVEPLAGWLMLPYLAWSTFAVALNGTIWRLNV